MLLLLMHQRRHHHTHTPMLYCVNPLIREKLPRASTTTTLQQCVRHQSLKERSPVYGGNGEIEQHQQQVLLCKASVVLKPRSIDCVSQSRGGSYQRQQQQKQQQLKSLL